MPSIRSLSRITSVRFTLSIAASLFGVTAMTTEVQATSLPTTNLVARYIAGTGITASGARVTQWNDQTGHGYHLTQGTGSAMPYIRTDWLGRPVVRLAQGERNYLIIPPALSLNARSQTIWVVKMGNGGNTSLIGAAGSTAGLVRYTGTPNTLAAGSKVSTFIPVLQPELIGAELKSSSSIIHITGSSQSFTALNAGNGSGGRLGSFTSGTATFPGDIYEVLIYAGNQSAQDVLDTKAYLTEYYNLVNTPPGRSCSKEIQLRSDRVLRIIRRIHSSFMQCPELRLDGNSRVLVHQALMWP